MMPLGSGLAPIDPYRLFPNVHNAALVDYAAEKHKKAKWPGIPRDDVNAIQNATQKEPRKSMTSMAC